MLGQTTDRTIPVLGGLLAALPFAFVELWLLMSDGPWWMPHPAGMPVINAWSWAVLICLMLTGVLTQAMALMLPPEIEWAEYWALYVTWGQGIGLAGVFVLMVAAEFYWMRQGLTIGIPLAAIGVHARAIIKTRT
ncbi:MAG: hypothetical protein JWM80_138 [Cyanobacteria bacterium RYN_339]|nr:hypothetical protein [Cyanobacteria bacterium RYN_339]